MKSKFFYSTHPNYTSHFCFVSNPTIQMSDDYGMGGAITSLAEQERIDRDLEQFEHNLRHKQKKRKTKRNKHQQTKPIMASITSPKMAQHTYTYTQLLQRAFSELDPAINIESMHGRDVQKVPVSIPSPELAIAGSRNTAWMNIIRICKILHRDPNHMKEFIEAECITTTRFNGANNLIMRGRFTVRNMTKILRKYIQKYVLCENCSSLSTIMSRNSSMRLYEITCDKCQSSRWCQRIEKAFKTIANRQQRTQQRQQAEMQR
eukprot:410200_1